MPAPDNNEDLRKLLESKQQREKSRIEKKSGKSEWIHPDDYEEKEVYIPFWKKYVWEIVLLLFTMFYIILVLFPYFANNPYYITKKAVKCFPFNALGVWLIQISLFYHIFGPWIAILLMYIYVNLEKRAVRISRWWGYLLIPICLLPMILGFCEYMKIIKWLMGKI